MSTLDSELGLGWRGAEIVDGRRLRHPNGAEIEAVHLGPSTSPIFAVFHRPPKTPLGVVVICSPPYVEAIRNHRRELLFGWLASERGLAAVRFHPRGGGHSGGDTAKLSLRTMLDDAEEVAAEAIERFQTPLTGFVGTRLGAVVAHRAANRFAGSAVAWWHPVLDAHSYMRELFRARLIGGLKRGVTTNRDELEARFRTDGILDVLGVPVSRLFYDSLFAHPLDDAPSGPREGLLVQMSHHNDLLRGYASFISGLRDGGWSVKTMIIKEEETWWFGARARGAELELRSLAVEMIPATVDFFLTAVGVNS